MAYWRISIISPEGEEEPLLLNPLLASMSSLRHLILAVFVCEITLGETKGIHVFTTRVNEQRRRCQAQCDE